MTNGERITAAVRVARIATTCHVLGPGRRGVLWVQGCPLRCRECIAPDTLAFEGGTMLAPEEVAVRLLADDPEGVTLSGGEPFAQAAVLCAVVDELRTRRPGLSVMSYSGFPLARLRRAGSPEQRALLDRLDLLVDGPYLPKRHAPLLWRGSSNQGLRVLTDKHRDLETTSDASVGLEAEIDMHSNLRWMGVPPVRGFAARLGRSTQAAGLDIEETRTEVA